MVEFMHLARSQRKISDMQRSRQRVRLNLATRAASHRLGFVSNWTSGRSKSVQGHALVVRSLAARCCELDIFSVPYKFTKGRRSQIRVRAEGVRGDAVGAVTVPAMQMYMNSADRGGK